MTGKIESELRIRPCVVLDWDILDKALREWAKAAWHKTVDIRAGRNDSDFNIEIRGLENSERDESVLHEIYLKYADRSLDGEESDIWWPNPDAHMELPAHMSMRVASNILDKRLYKAFTAAGAVACRECLVLFA